MSRSSEPCSKRFFRNKAASLHAECKRSPSSSPAGFFRIANAFVISQGDGRCGSQSGQNASDAFARCDRIAKKRSGSADRHADSNCKHRCSIVPATSELRGPAGKHCFPAAAPRDQARCRADICTNVCDMPAQFPAAFDFCDVDGVVKIASVIWINGHDKSLRRSSRPRWRRPSPSGIADVSSRTAAGNSTGKWYFRMIDRMSTPGAVHGPSSSMIFPSGLTWRDSHASSRTTTLSPTRELTARIQIRRLHINVVNGRGSSGTT